MELLQLKYFCTVAEVESVSQAARIHMIPQPAMSKTISKLEDELEMPLFDRLGRNIRLNSNGSAFYSYAKQALLLLDDARNAANQNNDTGSFCLRMLVNSARDMVQQYLIESGSEREGLTFYIDQHLGTDIAMTDLLDFHFCIGTECPHPSFDSYEDLLREQIVLAVNNKHPLASRKEVALSELYRENFVLLNNRYSMHAIVNQYLMQSGHPISVKAYCANAGFLRSAVRDGWAISFFPERSWKENDLDRICLIPLSDISIYQTQRIFWNSKRYLPPAALKFKDDLIAYFKGK